MTTGNRQHPPTIICVGQTVMDHRFFVAEIPTRAQKYLAGHYQALPGGMATGAAVAAARLGANVHLVSRLGDDANAAALLSLLHQEHIHTALTEQVSGCRTAVSAITIDSNGERQIVHASTDAFNRGTAIDAHQLPAANAVVVDPRWPQGSLAALCWAKEHSIPSVLDADVAPPDVLRELLPHVDWAVFSAHGLSHLFPGGALEDKLKQAASLGPNHVAVTCGEDGVQWLDGDQLETITAPDIPANDTTGAGDVFHGALAFALGLQHQAFNKVSGNIRSLLSFANQVAAKKVVNGQGIMGAPYAEDLQAEITSLLSTD